MLSTTDFNAQAELQHELLSNESLLWAGRPQTGIAFRLSDVFLIPFSVFWCGFAIFWEFSVISSGAPFFFMIWGIPFICMGLYMTIGRFIYDKYDRQKTWYGVTANRIIIKSGVFKTTVDTYAISNLSTLSIEEKANGTGSILLSPQTSPFGALRINMGGWPAQKKQPDIEFIDNVRSVYNLILQQQSHTK